jgi:hypothetical protein
VEDLVDWLRIMRLEFRFGTLLDFFRNCTGMGLFSLDGKLGRLLIIFVLTHDRA